MITIFDIMTVREYLARYACEVIKMCQCQVSPSKKYGNGLYSVISTGTVFDFDNFVKKYTE